MVLSGHREAAVQRRIDEERAEHQRKQQRAATIIQVCCYGERLASSLILLLIRPAILMPYAPILVIVDRWSCTATGRLASASVR